MATFMQSYLDKKVDKTIFLFCFWCYLLVVDGFMITVESFFFAAKLLQFYCRATVKSKLLSLFLNYYFIRIRFLF